MLFATTLVMMSTVIINSKHRFSAVDFAAAVIALCAFALATSTHESGLLRARLIDASFAGLMAGFALSYKISYGPLIGTLFICFLVRPSKIYLLKSRLQTALCFLFFVFLTSSAWYLQNWWLTGNPVFPTKLGPFSGPLDSEK